MIEHRALAVRVASGKISSLGSLLINKMNVVSPGKVTIDDDTEVF